MSECYGLFVFLFFWGDRGMGDCPLLIYNIYYIYPKYWDRQACANSVEPDKTPQKLLSDQGLQWLPLIQHFFRHMKR